MVKTHTHQISEDHHTKEDGSKDELLILQDNLDGNIHKNTKICVRREITTFVGITILSTQLSWILLKKVQ